MMILFPRPSGRPARTITAPITIKGPVRGRDKRPVAGLLAVSPGCDYRELID
jgi:hypothetical protein